MHQVFNCRLRSLLLEAEGTAVDKADVCIIRVAPGEIIGIVGKGALLALVPTPLHSSGLMYALLVLGTCSVRHSAKSFGRAACVRAKTCHAHKKDSRWKVKVYSRLVISRRQIEMGIGCTYRYTD